MNRLRRRAQAIAMRRRERLRIILRRLRLAHAPLLGKLSRQTGPDFARRVAQARALLSPKNKE